MFVTPDARPLVDLPLRLVSTDRLMNVGAQQRVTEVAAADLMLRDLCRPFAPPDFAPQCVVVHPDAIPHPQDDLLVHHDHMTVMLERHHGSPVEVQVHREQHDQDRYTRQITLTPRQLPDRIVEWGLVRLNFRYIPDPVREEILARQTPLGAILIKHNVHRRVKPLYFLRFPQDGAVMTLFGSPATGGAVFGRLGLIYCDGEPAIELLEIVGNTEQTA